MTSQTLSTRSPTAVAPSVWASLAICMGVGPLILYTWTALSPLLIQDLSLTPAQYGSIATVVYVSAGATALMLGGLTSRVPARTLMISVSIGMALAFCLLAMSTRYWMVLAVAVVAGAAQALSNPATNHAVAALPAARRGALAGWKQSGVQMAQLLAGLLAPSVALLAGWRVAVLSYVAVAAVGVISARRMPLVARQLTSPGLGVGASVSVRVLAAYSFFMGFGVQATNAYLPLFSHQRLDFGVRAAGLTAAMVGVSGVVSRIWVGRRTDQRGLSRTTLAVLAIGSAVGVALILAAPWVGGWLVWVGAAIFGVAALASNSVVMASLIHSVSAARLGAATGIVATGLYLGFACGPLAYGIALDLGASYEVAWLIPLLVFAVASVFGVLSVPLDQKGTPC